MTTAPFKKWAEKSGFFDNIYITTRPKWYQFSKLLEIRNFILSFDQVYDLQNNGRMKFYYHMLWPNKKPLWAGNIKNCEYPISQNDIDVLHAYERHKKMLNVAGITNIEPIDVSQMKSDITALNLPTHFFAISPSAAPHRILKRWHPLNYAKLINELYNIYQLPTVIIGTKNDQEIIDEIMANTPNAINLMDKTALFDIISIGYQASYCIGNDTGPMHILSATNCPALVLFSKDSKPEKSLPIGQNVSFLRQENINDISVADVINVIRKKLN